MDEETAQLFARLRIFVSTLDGDHRRVLVLRFGIDQTEPYARSTSEIAKIMNMSISIVKRLEHEALQQLRKQ